MRIAVGMSGGVDSSVAAYLLKMGNHDVIGVTMKTWDGSVSIEDERRSGCFGPGEARDIAAAARICQRLGIEHRVIDLSKEYKEEILEYFRDEYLKGRTPNPCTRCNRLIKFGMLISKAREEGLSFQRFATGHYAQIEVDNASGEVVLKRGRDVLKDQSYFLALLGQEQLKEILLPLGSLTKEEVRAIAREQGWIDIAEQPESQDFIESKDFGSLFAADELKGGQIVDEKGSVIGEHKGIVNYTIGQRKGIGGGASEALYVIGIDADKALVKVGKRESLLSKGLIATNLNWLGANKIPTEGLWLSAKIRQSHKMSEAFLVPMGGSQKSNIMLTFKEAQRAVTPGQTVAFYDGDIVLGGAIISEALKS